MAKLKQRVKQDKVNLKIDNVDICVVVQKMTRDEGIAWYREFSRHNANIGDEDLQKALTEAQRIAADDAAGAFIVDSIKKYCTLPEGEIDIEDDDSVEVKHVLSGEDIVAAYATRFDVLFSFMASIRYVNFLGDEEKNDSRSRRIFFPGSKQPTPTRNGAGPDATAGAVDKRDSVSDAAATASSAQALAGDQSATTSADAR